MTSEISGRGCRWARTATLLTVIVGFSSIDVALGAEPRPLPPPSGGVRRVVSLVPSVTETVFAIGAGDRLVGVSAFCDRPAEATRLPRAGSYLSPDIEAIVALKPDVVIGVPTPGNRVAVERLLSMGVNVVVVGEATLDDAWQAHKVRNQIAHAGADFVLTQKITRETIMMYKRVFEELGAGGGEAAGHH